jgi:hypothetical protein
MPIPAGPEPAVGGPCSAWVDAATVAARPDIAAISPAPDTDLVASAVTVASSLLFELSGRQYPGACTSTVRPYAGRYGCCHPHHPQVWDSLTAATNGAVSICGNVGLDLRLYPVRSVVEVKIDGEVLPESDYRLDGQRWLMRPGLIWWPPDQRLDLPDTEVGTFAVTVLHGADPPPHGVAAASRLAAELVRDWTPGQKSALPGRVTSVTRQGVSITRNDAAAAVKDGLVGVWEVDSFIASVNPARQRSRPLVWSPDVAQRRRV